MEKDVLTDTRERETARVRLAEGEEERNWMLASTRYTVVELCLV